MMRGQHATRVAVIAALAIVSAPSGRADPPAGAATPTSGAESSPANTQASGAVPHSMSQSGVVSSFAQSWRGADHDIVYGHFDLGEGARQHRYYCLADERSGKRQPNGVLGDPFVQKNGTTAIHMSSVSMYTCSDAEHAGFLITSGYHTNAAVERAAAAAVASVPAPTAPAVSTAAASPPVSASATTTTVAPAEPAPVSPGSALAATAAAAAAEPPSSTGRSPEGVAAIEVDGVHLGMTPEEVRAVLRARWLPNYWEGRETLRPADSAAARSLERNRFLSMISAWSTPAGGAGGESLEVYFTPIPGRERVFAIVHTTAYAAEHAVRQDVLESLLEQKYGGFDRSNPLPASPTWRWLRGGRVEVGDACEQRGVFGGLHEVVAAPSARANPALSLPLEELESQSSRCGIAIVTEDHLTLNGSAPRADRRVLRFTISAYSPMLALEGARTAHESQGASGSTRPVRAERPSEPSPADL